MGLRETLFLYGMRNMAIVLIWMYIKNAVPYTMTGRLYAKNIPAHMTSVYGKTLKTRN